MPKYQHPADDQLGPSISVRRLRIALHLRRMSQREFARRCGVSHDVMSQFLLERTPGTLRVRYRIAHAIRALGLEADGLIIDGDDGLVVYSEHARRDDCAVGE